MKDIRICNLLTLLAYAQQVLYGIQFGNCCFGDAEDVEDARQAVQIVAIAVAQLVVITLPNVAEAFTTLDANRVRYRMLMEGYSSDMNIAYLCCFVCSLLPILAEVMAVIVRGIHQASKMSDMRLPETYVLDIASSSIFQNSVAFAPKTQMDADEGFRWLPTVQISTVLYSPCERALSFIQKIIFFADALVQIYANDHETQGELMRMYNAERRLHGALHEGDALNFGDRIRLALIGKELLAAFAEFSARRQVLL
jgi:hypothetical protein